MMGQLLQKEKPGLSRVVQGSGRGMLLGFGRTCSPVRMHTTGNGSCSASAIQLHFSPCSFQGLQGLCQPLLSQVFSSGRSLTTCGRLLLLVLLFSHGAEKGNQSQAQPHHGPLQEALSPKQVHFPWAGGLLGWE